MIAEPAAGNGSAWSGPAVGRSESVGLCGRGTSAAVGVGRMSAARLLVARLADRRWRRGSESMIVIGGSRMRRRQIHLRAHHDREQRDVGGDDEQQRVGTGLASAARAAGGVGKHLNLLSPMRLDECNVTSLHNCSAREISLRRLIRSLALGGGFEAADRAVLAHARDKAGHFRVRSRAR